MPEFLLWRWEAIDSQGQVKTGATLAGERSSLEEELSKRPGQTHTLAYF